MHRRNVLKLATGVLSAAAFGKILFHESLAHADASSNLTPISFDDFQVKLHELTNDFLIDVKNEESYLYAISSLLKRVSNIPELTFGNPFDLGGGAQFFKGKKQNHISINKLTLDPHSYLKAHDHRFYVGILVCLEGSGKCRNFNILDEDGSKILIQKTSEISLQKGDIALILQGKNNLHDLRTFGSEMKCYDIYTFIDEARAQSKFLDIDESSWNPASETFEAKWI